MDPPTVGSTSPPLSHDARNAADSASASSGLTSTSRPAARWSAEISESVRNRLHARSSSASRVRSNAVAGPSAASSVTSTRAVVPSAENSAGYGPVTTHPSRYARARSRAREPAAGLGPRCSIRSRRR